MGVLKEMAEYIERDAAREIVVELQKSLCPVGQYGRGYVYGIERDMYDELEKILDDVDAIPAADVVEVVRCGECKYYDNPVCTLLSEKPSQYSTGSVVEMEYSDFCSYGERKE